ncbi:MAG: beta-propeller fold lactonase family protein [Steroidobacteraceae bacterium]
MTAITRRSALQIAAAAAISAHPLLRARAAGAMRQVFVGSYTNASGESIPAEFGTRGADHISRGIYSFDFDAGSGRVGSARLAAEVTNPVNLILHANGRTLYACRGQNTRVQGQNAITAFAIEGGALRELNTVPSGGGGPTVGVVDRSGANLLTTNFSTHSIVCFRLDADGSPGRRSALIGSEPRGELPTAQAPGALAAAGVGAVPSGAAPGSASGNGADGGRTKPHAIVLSRTQRFAIASEIEANRCHVLRFDAATGALSTHGYASDDRGCGPRHLCFHPSFRYLYTSGEGNSTVSAWRWNEDKGTLTLLQTLSVLPPDFTGSNHPADIAMHPSGRFVYVTNRGAGNIACFAIDASSGRLSAAGQTLLGSPACWSVIFDPSGRWALASLQTGDAVAVYAVDEKSGALRATDQAVAVTLPSCLRMV